MSRAESFLRGGTPCTEVPELIDVLSSAGKLYTRWRFVAYYPQRWLHDTVENRMTAPLYFLVFAAATAAGADAVDAGAYSPISTAVGNSVQDARSPTTHPNSPPLAHENEASEWHLLCHTVLPNGAIPHESIQRDGVADNGSGGGGGGRSASIGSAAESVTVGGGGVGALRTLLRTLPSGLHPSVSLEWLSVMDGQAYQRMGLMSQAIFESTVAPAVAEVLGRHWKPRSYTPVGGGNNEEEIKASLVACAHYVHNSRCASSVNFVRRDASAPSLGMEKRATSDAAVRPFVDSVVRAVARWITSVASLRTLTTDASVPALPQTCRDVLYPAVSSLPRCLYTSLFVEAEHVTALPSAPLADPETLTGMAKLRAERDAGIAQWKQKVGEYTSFTLPGVAGGAPSSACPSPSPAATRPFRHVILLQRPIEDKKHIDVDNRDAGPLAPQPIGAELHLLQDRGDVLYTLEQLGNRSNIHFLYVDTLPDDGEVLVQLTPVEGTPFDDLEAYFQCVPTDSPVLTAAPASRCADSCCGVVVPRVLFRRPTGKTQKVNPIATAQVEVEVLPPTAEMTAAAVAALHFLAAHVEELKGSDGGSPALPPCAAASSFNTKPPRGYTLKVPPVDLALVPSKKCGWCGRRREALLRCGSCKTVLYCCKRHQALDWKEGSHKVECKLWRHARELHECVVERWAAGTSLTWKERNPRDARAGPVQKGKGWSCAATLVQFIKDVETEAARHGVKGLDGLSGGVFNIHVTGVDSASLDEFLRVVADQLGELAHTPHQYRVLLCADAFSDAQRNAVWAVWRSPTGDQEAPLWLTPSTGILGDTWHSKGSNEEATGPAACVALVRCYGVKYHNVNRGDCGSGDSPSAILSFGPFNGEGCTYLNAALEVFAGQDVGTLPLRLVDSSYVGAVRTRDALHARLRSSDVCPAATKSRASELITQAKEREGAEVCDAAAQTYVASGGQRHPFQIVFNDAGAVAQEVTETETPPTMNSSEAAAVARETREARAGSAVPHFVNSYMFDAYPSDF
jgi:hypothetical protein